MKILKYQKLRGNEYKIFTSKGEYTLYDDIIIKYELLLKKEISPEDLNKIIKENNFLKAYYIALKSLSNRMRTEKELNSILTKKNFNSKEIEYALNRLNKENYLNHDTYINAYIHDMLNIYLVGERKIYQNLINLGFKPQEITPYLEEIDPNIYITKITKYINKKLKSNKKSINEFKRKTTIELLNKGFNKENISEVLNNISITEDKTIIKKLITKEYNKYIKKYDLYTTKQKIRQYLYQKGYTNIDIDNYL